MRTHLDRIITAVTLIASAASANAGSVSLELQVDGMHHIKGSSLNGARAVIVSDDMESTVLQGGLAHFAHAFQLQTRYLISFEREGCVTKQILFDTHVPMEYTSHAPFSFPFEVTLERPPNGTIFEYAGPVGFVRFMPELADFGYDTDYSIKRDPMLFERMRAFRDKDAAPLVAAIVANADALITEASPSRDPLDGDGVLAPTLSAVPPLVHPTGEALMPLALPREEAIARMNATPVRIEMIPVMKALPVSAIVVPVTAVVMPQAAPASSVPGESRDEQLIVDPRSVTTIVRITHSGATQEFRRVAHQYGAVFYFLGGQSCTERQYGAGVAQPTASR